MIAAGALHTAVLTFREAGLPDRAVALADVAHSFGFGASQSGSVSGELIQHSSYRTHHAQRKHFWKAPRMPILVEARPTRSIKSLLLINFHGALQA